MSLQHLIFQNADSDNHNLTTVDAFEYKLQGLEGIHLVNEDENLGVGTGTLRNATLSATGNLAVGEFAGTNLTTGDNNTFVGNESGKLLTTGTNNTCVGNNSGGALTVGQSNTCVGTNAGSLITTGTGNILIGNSADSKTLTTGSSNIVIGVNSSVQNPSDQNCIVLGNQTTGNGSDTLTIPANSIREATNLYADNNVLQFHTGTSEVTRSPVINLPSTGGLNYDRSSILVAGDPVALTVTSSNRVLLASFTGVAVNIPTGNSIELKVTNPNCTSISVLTCNIVSNTANVADFIVRNITINGSNVAEIEITNVAAGTQTDPFNLTVLIVWYSYS